MKEVLVSTGRTSATILVERSEADQPLLFQRREYLAATPNMATTTSCQKTSNPADYGPDD